MSNVNLDDADHDPKHLYPPFAELLEKVLAEATRECRGKPFAPHFKQWAFFEGYRSSARQTHLYAQGRTRPGKRVTNARKPVKHGFGLAADLVWYDENDAPHWDGPPELWAQMAHAARLFGLEWGGDWKSKAGRRLGDVGHIQMPDAYKAQHLPAIVAYLHSQGLTTA